MVRLSLVNRVQVRKIYTDTSTLRTIDTPPMVTTDDRWFRIVDTKAGPDGTVYFADWYDSRLIHLDPRDTWHKSSSRIYRMHAKGSKPINLGKLTSGELINVLKHPKKGTVRNIAIRIKYFTPMRGRMLNLPIALIQKNQRPAGWRNSFPIKILKK